MKIFYIISIMFFGTCFSANASELNKAHSLGVGQGIANPSVTSTVNFSAGFTSENPVGVLYQEGFRVSGEYDQNGSKGYGGEAGFSTQTWGIAAGYYDRDCEGCEGDVAGSLGASVAGIGLGARIAEDLYGLGAIFNYDGKIRLGVMAELNQGGGSDITSFGFGVAVVSGQWTFVVDASKTNSDSVADDDLILVTPGLILHSDMFQVSINYQARTNSDSDDDGDLWMGLGVDLDFVHLAVYSDYVNDISAAATFTF